MTPPVPPPDDPAAPLEAYLMAVAGLLGDHDDDPTVPVGMTLTATGGEHGYGRVTLTVGDLRRAVGEIGRLRADNLRLNAQLDEERGRAAAASRVGPADLGGLKRLCGDLYREGRYDQFNDVEDAYKELRELRAEAGRLGAENKALRTDLDVACSVFSKRTWTGSLDLPFAWHVARGRRMAMLKAEAADLPCRNSIVL